MLVGSWQNTEQLVSQTWHQHIKEEVLGKQIYTKHDNQDTHSLTDMKSTTQHLDGKCSWLQPSKWQSSNKKQQRSLQIDPCYL